LYRFLAIAVLLDVKDIPQVGSLQWGRIMIEDRFPNVVITDEDVDQIEVVGDLIRHIEIVE